MLYQYKTQEFVRLIENLVAQGRTSKALEELLLALPQNNPLKREVLQNLGMYKEITWREYMGFGMDFENKNKIQATLLFYFLDELRKRHPRQIPLVSTNFIKSNLQAINKPIERSFLEVQWLKFQYITKYLIYNFKKVLKFAFIVIAIGIIGFVMFRDPSKSSNVKSQEARIIKPTRIEFKPSGPVWVAYLREFDNFDDANKEEIAYRARKIKIVEIESGSKYWNVIIPKDYTDMQNADEKISDRVRNTWNKAKVINLRDSCTTIKYDNENSKLVICR